MNSVGPFLQRLDSGLNSNAFSQSYTIFREAFGPAVWAANRQLTGQIRLRRRFVQVDKVVVAPSMMETENMLFCEYYIADGQHDVGSGRQRGHTPTESENMFVRAFRGWYMLGTLCVVDADTDAFNFLLYVPRRACVVYVCVIFASNTVVLLSHHLCKLSIIWLCRAAAVGVLLLIWNVFIYACCDYTVE